MRIFVKLLILILIFGSFNPAFAENYTLTPEEEKVYQEYFDAYTQKLYDAFQPQEKFFRKNVHNNSFALMMRRDGTIYDEHEEWLYDKPFKNYCLKILRSIEPVPFPPEMKEDEIYVDVWFYYVDGKWGEEVKTSVNPNACVNFYPPNAPRRVHNGVYVRISIEKVPPIKK